MAPGTLRLLFPQWQGSGRDNELYIAAREFAAACTDLEFTQIKVPETDPLEPQGGILGYGSILSQMQKVSNLVRTASPDVIITVGGDCGIEPVPVSFLNEKYHGDFTLVWLDAHGDLNTPETSPSGLFHGMPLATLLGLGDPELCRTCLSTLSPDQVILAGARSLDPAESELIRSSGITRVSAADMETDPDALTRAIARKEKSAVYIHIDLDVLDPGHYPYIRCPEPGGIRPQTLEAILEDIKDRFIVAGAGFMEFTLAPFNGKARDDRGLDFIKTLMAKV